MYLYRRRWDSFTSDGEKVAISCVDRGVELWNLSGGILVGKFAAIGDEPALSPDGTRLVSYSAKQNNAAEIWNTVTKESIGIMPDEIRDKYEAPLGIVFTSDSKKIAVANYSEVSIWDAETGDLLKRLSDDETIKLRKLRYTPPESRIYDLEFTSDGKTLITGSGKAIKFWDVETGELKFNADGKHKGVFNDLDISPDGQLLATVSDDGEIRIWEMSSGKLVKSLKKPKETTQEIKFSPNGRFLCFRSFRSDKEIIYNIESGSIVWQDKYGVFTHVISPLWDKVLVKDSKTQIISAYEMKIGLLMK